MVGRRVAALLLTATLAATAQDSTAHAPVFRARVLGVFDPNTGLALEKVDVTDLKSGVTQQTNPAGLVSLAFLPEGGSLVRLKKVGYQPLTRFIAISPDDTVCRADTGAVDCAPDFGAARSEEGFADVSGERDGSGGKGQGAGNGGGG